MTPKICFITGSRAEYGIMAPIMRLIAASGEADLQVMATNMHLSPDYGLTYREIEADGLTVDAKVEMLLSSDTPTGTVKSMGVELIGMADALERLAPDVAVVLGDRYEMLAAASSALIFGIPIVHLHGGETTLGAYDNAIRHAITQLASLHLTSTEEYRDRVVSMGKDPSAVHCIGSPAADTIAFFEPMPVAELSAAIGFDLGERYLVATYHPVTLEPGEAGTQTRDFLDALATLPQDVNVLFTLPNSDTGARAVRAMIEEWAAARPERVKAVDSLGARRYLSAVAGSKGVIGNSSSGLIEAPSFGVPTLNVGNRQAGRARGRSVIDVEATREGVERGLRMLLSDAAQAMAKRSPNPYYVPGTVRIAARLIIDFAKENCRRHD